MKLRPLAALVVSLVSSTAFAEISKVNFHLEPAVGSGVNRNFLVSGAALKVDLRLIKLPLGLAPSIEGFGFGSQESTYLVNGALFGGGVGLRIRPLNDENGYLIVRNGKSGNAWGNLWADAHFIVTSGPRVGFDVALGYEFSLIDGLQIGPFVQFRLAGPDMVLTGGLSFTVGGPVEEVPAADAPPEAKPAEPAAPAPSQAKPASEPATDAKPADAAKPADGAPATQP